MKELIIKKEENGKSLFAYLKKLYPVTFVYKIFRKNGVRVNSEKGYKDTVLKTNDKVMLYIYPEDENKQMTPKTKPHAEKSKYKEEIEVLFDHKDFAIINKRTGVAVQEWTSVPYKETLEYFAKEFFKKTNEQVFLVHRLDRDTSGCIIIAKNEEAQQKFVKMLKISDINKEYLTLVKGILKKPKGAINIPLEGRKNDIVHAMTFYEVSKTFPKSGVSLVKAKIKTGRMHQIRKHFAKRGYPVVMDNMYGDFKFNKEFQKKTGLKRQFLHAAKIAFEYNGEKIKVESKLPLDLEKTIELL